jgi:hypothetical protein
VTPTGEGSARRAKGGAGPVILGALPRGLDLGERLKPTRLVPAQTRREHALQERRCGVTSANMGGDSHGFNRRLSHWQ